MEVQFLPLLAIFCSVCMTLLPVMHSPFWFVEVSLSSVPFAFTTLSTSMSSIAFLLSNIALTSVDADGTDYEDDGFADDASSFSIISIAGDVIADLAWLTPSPFVSASAGDVIADSTWMMPSSSVSVSLSDGPCPPRLT